MKFLTPEEVFARKQIKRKLFFAGSILGAGILSVIVTLLVNEAL